MNALRIVADVVLMLLMGLSLVVLFAALGGIYLFAGWAVVYAGSFAVDSWRAGESMDAVGFGVLTCVLAALLAILTGFAAASLSERLEK